MLLFNKPPSSNHLCSILPSPKPNQNPHLSLSSCSKTSILVPSVSNSNLLPVVSFPPTHPSHSGSVPNLPLFGSKYLTNPK